MRRAITAGFIVLADTSRIIQGQKSFSREEITRWTLDNATVPVIASTERDVKAGALFSIVTSELAIGQEAAAMALKILNGTAPSDIPMVASSKGKLVINATTAQKMNLDIPYDILITAEAIYEQHLPASCSRDHATKGFFFLHLLHFAEDSRTLM